MSNYEFSARLIRCCLIGLLACSSLSCGKDKPAVDWLEVMLKSAESIVREPQNWQKNTSLLVDFQMAAEKCNLADDDAIKTFESAATKLVTFGTGWTKVANQQQLEEYRKLSLEAIAGLSISQTVSGDIKGGGSLELGDSSKKILELISRSLDDSESKQFESTWTNALNAFKALNVKHGKKLPKEQ